MLTSEILQQAPIQSILIAISVIGLQSLWQIPAKFHPLTFFRLVGVSISHKVNHPERSDFQQLIAGSLAPILLLLPLFVMLYFLLELVYFRWFFEAVILFISLYSFSAKRDFYRLYRHLAKQNKQLSKHTLASLVLREVETLSPLGCAKAAMESLSLRFYYQSAAVLFWFFSIGPLMALFVRLTLELHYIWHLRLTRFAVFGKPIDIANKLLQWVPARLHSFLIVCLYRPSSIKIWFRHLNRPIRELLMAITAHNVQCELGGPAFYNNKKTRFERHNSQHPTKLDHMLIVGRYLNFKLLILVVSYAMITLSLYFPTQSI